MSWVEKIKSGIVITCGDGKVYEPLYVLTSKSVEYNISEFEFVNISGALVKRFKPKARKYNFELTFQGENHLDQSESFERSASDERPWTISHPFYGQLLVQPTGLTFDPTGINTTVISGEFIETISEEYPKISKDPTDNSNRFISVYKQTSADSFSSRVDPNTDDVLQLSGDADSAYKLGSETVEAGDLSNEYFQLYNRALTAINNAANDASTAATLAIDLFTYPAKFKTAVSARLRLLLNQFEELTYGLENLLTPNSKSTYEMNAGALVSAMAETAVNPEPGDYDNINNVLPVIDTILNTHNSFIDNLNSLQSDNGANITSYFPSPDGITDLTETVDYVVSHLMEIASNAKQERTFILDKDYNPIILAHRFYGLSEDTSNVQKFIKENNITGNLLQIKKGTSVVYYV